MSQNSNLPICTGDIEIEVPAGVTGNIVFHLDGEDLICPVRNGVIKIDEKAAAHFLAGNNGRPLPGYRKSVTELKDLGEQGGNSGQGGAPTDIPTIDQVKAFLKERGVAFHPATGAAKLQALYAAEMVKPAPESFAGPGTAETAALAVDALAALTLEGLNAALPGTEDPELLKQMIAAEVSGQSREDFIVALENRLNELGA